MLVMVFMESQLHKDMAMINLVARSEKDYGDHKLNNLLMKAKNRTRGEDLRARHEDVRVVGLVHLQLQDPEHVVLSKSKVAMYLQFDLELTACKIMAFGAVFGGFGPLFWVSNRERTADQPKA